MPALRIEHVAFNVAEPVAMAAWYVAHLGMRVVRRLSAAPHTHFLADASGSMLIELYSNPAAPVPSYADIPALQLHVAFVTVDPDAAVAELLAAGATPVDDQTLGDGSRLVMLRDPWGLALQVCRRALPMLPEKT
jgi:glyoxylase I family protein